MASRIQGITVEIGGDSASQMFHGRFLGYKRGDNGLPEIIEKEAQIVQLIFRLFLYGKSPSAIAAYLTGEGIPTPGRENYLAE